MNYKGVKLSCVAVVALGMMMIGCVGPSSSKTDGGVSYADGSRSAGTIEFSDYMWRLKESSGLVGPGPNWFSGGSDNVWVDDEGRLHMKITHRNGKWICSELVCETPMGYGMYTFYMASRIDQVDPNVVVGLFTWDDEARQSQANCEVDIEFARWTEANAPNLHYSVQPCRGPDDPSGRYRERFYAARMELPGPLSTHVFEWTPEGLAFAGFEGHQNPTPHVIANWEYDAGNPARRAAEGMHVSDPVGVPQPGPGTRFRFNLWLVDADGDGRGNPPSDGQEVEVVVQRFTYTPLK